MRDRGVAVGPRAHMGELPLVHARPFLVELRGVIRPPRFLFQRSQAGIFRRQAGDEFGEVVDGGRRVRGERAEEAGENGEQREAFHCAGVVAGLVDGELSLLVGLAVARMSEDWLGCQR